MPMSALTTPVSGASSRIRAPKNASVRAHLARSTVIPYSRDCANTPLLTKDDVEIWLADSDRSDEIDTLVSRMYGQRGYLIPARRNPVTSARRVTLEARHEGSIVGTLTVSLGTARGLNADELYAAEIQPYRDQGATVCEFTRLALDSELCSKQALACLFHMGFVYAYRILRASDLFIEVNPRHALFYCRKLHFRLAGGEKICPRVSAPAVLLHKDLKICAEEINRCGGRRAPENKTFYAFMLTPSEERACLDNIRELHVQHS